MNPPLTLPRDGLAFLLVIASSCGAPQILNDCLDEYNVTFANQMNIVFFADAVVHVTRVGRVLRQPRGNVMLVGVGGSGKQSLTRIAAFVAGYECVQIEINRGYGLMEFREDIKKIMASQEFAVGCRAPWVPLGDETCLM